MLEPENLVSNNKSLDEKKEKEDDDWMAEMWYIFVIGGVVCVLTVILSISYICSLYGMCCVCYCFTTAKEADKAN